MEKLFIEYEEALVLKELGFDEPCFRYWNDYGKTSINRFQLLDKIDEWCQDYVEAPLYQQAFKWLLNIRQDLCLSFWCDGSGKCTDSSPYDDSVFEFNTELECLKKLIEIIKKK